jgi:hypothetical protein
MKADEVGRHEAGTKFGWETGTSYTDGEHASLISISLQSILDPPSLGGNLGHS